MKKKKYHIFVYFCNFSLYLHIIMIKHYKWKYVRPFLAAAFMLPILLFLFAK